MDENLSDEQQADAIRNWLRENTAFILGGIIVAVGGLFGWQQWQDYEANQAELASALYEEILIAVRASQVTQADEVFVDLDSRFSGSPYVDQARFVLAKSFMDRADFDAAVVHLDAIINHTKIVEMRHIAALRLARVYLQQQKFDLALDALGDGATSSAFAARYDDVRGDIFYAQGQFEEARVAYEAALSNAGQPPVIDRVYVQAKVDALGGARDVAVPIIDDEPAE